MPTQGQSTQGQPGSQANLNAKIDRLITHIEILVDGLGRSDKFGTERMPSLYNAGLFSEVNDSIRTRDTFKSNFDFNVAMDALLNGLQKKLEEYTETIKANIKSIEDLNDKIADLESNINRSPEEDATLVELKDTRNRLEKNLKETKEYKKEIEDYGLKRRSDFRKASKNSDKRREVFEISRQRKLKKAIDAQWSSMSKLTKATLGYNEKLNNELEIKEKLAHFATEDTRYALGTQNRNKAINDIARSGFGNTKVGRYAQTLIGYNQRIEDIGNFGRNLQKGGAENIARSLFGSGKDGGLTKTGTKAAQALSKFGGGLDNVAGKLSGMGGVIGGVIGVVIAFGQAASAALAAMNATALNTYKNQSQAYELEAERQKSIAVANIDMQTEQAKVSGDLQLKRLQMEGQIMLNALKITTEQYVKSVEVAITPLTEGINAAAYKAANAAIDAAAEIRKSGILQRTLGGKYAAQAAASGTQLGSYMKTKEAEIGHLNVKTNVDQGAIALNNFNYNQQHYVGHEVNETFNDSYKNEHSAYVNQMKGAGIDVSRGNLSTLQGKLGNEYGGFATDEAFGKTLLRDVKDIPVIGSVIPVSSHEERQALMTEAYKFQTMAQVQAASFNQAITSAQANYANTVASIGAQIKEQALNIEKEREEIIIDAAKEVAKMWLQFAQKTEEYLEKFDTATNDMGISMGLTNKDQLQAYQKSMLETNKYVAQFGKSYEDMEKLQKGYAETTGRNRFMTNTDYGQAFMLGKYLGDDGMVAQYTSEMEIFNAGVSDSVELLDKSLQNVNRIGLNGRKYTKTLMDNLRLSQKYNFKDGTKGLMEMAKWAENTRFNLSSMGGMIDNIWEGGLEGLLTKGAGFQVLGGSAAMNADPIAMMYEAYSDPAALMRRYQDMTRGFGEVDLKTGETTFSGMETMHMQQLAKLQGRSYEEVANEVRARNKKNVVARELGFNADEDELSLISNNATYNRKTGQFEVQVRNANGQYEAKNVSDLEKGELDSIMTGGHDERMEEYMKSLLSAVENVSAEEFWQRADVAASTYEAMLNAYKERTEKAHEDYAEKRDEYIKNAKEGMDAATAAFQNYMENWKKGNDAVDKEVANIKAMANNINSQLAETARLIGDANRKIAAASSGVGGGGGGLSADTGTQNKNETNSLANNTIRQILKNNNQGNLNTLNVLEGIRKNSKLTQSERNKQLLEYFNKSDNGVLGMGGYHSLQKRLREAGGEEVWNNASQQEKINIINSILDAYAQNKPYINTKNGTNSRGYGFDIYSSSNNNSNPIISNVSEVKKINDGFVQADKNDEILAAKPGGVIDKGINETHSKINTIADYLTEGNKVGTPRQKVTLEMSDGREISYYIGEVEKNMKSANVSLEESSSKAQEAMSKVSKTASNIGDSAQSLHNAMLESAKVLLSGVVEIKQMLTGVKGVKDGIIPSNGISHLISGVSNVKSINDGIVKTHPDDEIFAAKQGGGLYEIFNGTYNGVRRIENSLGVLPMSANSQRFGGGNPSRMEFNELKLNVNGTIKLDYNGQTHDLGDDIVNNPLFLKELSRELTRQLQTSSNFGMGMHQLMNGNPHMTW